MNSQGGDRARPNISIIIPVYNGDKFIANCLESIVRQSYPDFECIIVDDGSTDQTMKIVRSIADPRFKALESEHVGSSAARNRGFLESSGEYVIFLDSDDVFNVNLLHTLHESIVIHKSEIAICNYRKYDTIHDTYSDKILDVVDLPAKVFCANDIPDHILNIFSGVAWNKLYRKKFLEDKNIMFLDGLVIGADSLFVHKAHLAADRICYVDDILVDYRVNNPNSDVERAGNYLADISRTVDELYSVISGEDNHVIFLRSFDNWAIGKCLWIYKLRGDQIDPVLVDIVRRYDLSSRPKDYYYQVSARELLARIEINNL